MANTLFAFVGKKIAVTPIPSCEDCLDAAFEAKYQVLQKVYGDYQGDTITFTVYDHYGTPAFANYDHALLFVSQGKRGWYHEKYQFFDVYLTHDGRWAGPCKIRTYYDTNKLGAIKPERIPFPAEAAFSLKGKTWEEGEVAYWFPAPYYTIENDKAMPIYGNYVHDLFRLKKQTVLAQLFDEDSGPNELDIVDTKMAEIKPTHRIEKNDKRFVRFWDKMSGWIKARDTAQLKGLLLDSLLVGEHPMAAPDFWQHCYPQLVDDKLKAHLTDTLSTSLVWLILDKQSQPYYIAQQVIRDRGQYRAWEVEIRYNEKYLQERSCRLQFIETKKGFKLFSWQETYHENCCQ